MLARRTGQIARLALLLLAPLLLGACSQPSAVFAPSAVPTEAVDTARYQKDPPYTFCFSNASASNSWRLSMVEHLRYEVRHHPEVATYREADARDDPATQVADIARLLAEGCDVLLVSPATLTDLKPPIDAAMAAGVPVILIDRTVTGDNYISYVAADNCTIGRLQAEWLVNRLGGQGDIVLLSGVKGSSVAEDRLRCARAVFAQHSGIYELAHTYANWSPVDGRKAMRGWLAAFDHINGIWSDGSQGVGAVEAYLDVGLPVPPITGGDINVFLKQWKRNHFSAVAVSYPARVGQIAVTTALDVLAGKPVPHRVDVPLAVITDDVLDNYVRMDLPDGFWSDSDPEVVKLMFPQ